MNNMLRTHDLKDIERPLSPLQRIADEVARMSESDLEAAFLFYEERSAEHVPTLANPSGPPLEIMHHRQQVRMRWEAVLAQRELKSQKVK